jgi:hypothetical protein
MKKIYINPETKIVRIETACHMLETSQMEKKGDFSSGEITIGARNGGSIWDEEDEEY